MIRLKFVISVFLLFWVCHFSIANAQDKISFALLEWPPHTTQKSEGYGVASELISAICKEMNLEPQYHFYPLKRLLGYIEEGRHWAAFPGSHTKQRAERFFYSDPIFPQVDRLFYYKKKPDLIFNTLEDLRPFTIGGTKGFWYEEEFKKAGLNTYYVSEDRVALNMLIHGRVDLVALNDVVGWQLIKTHFPDEIQNFAVIQPPLKVKKNYLLASKTYPNSEFILDQFNLGLKKVKELGIYRKIAQKYGMMVDP
ncbi:MAG: transporter substrate-binding domain-containing protein [Magnetococcales bacterium]|nr:transporter substrate-binding domain-containing protein [Magnetococcales bacterium]